MNNYIILTDSSCDISPEVLLEWGIGCIDMKFMRSDEPRVFSNSDIPAKVFYDVMRDGTEFKTSTINPEEYKDFFREYLERGSDIIYIGFSSGLSSTVSSAKNAADELTEEYPRRTILVSDSLCGSAGQGLLLCYAAKKRDGGASIHELAAYVSELAPKICHWYIVDDLKYLKRGGRISASKAFAATVLDIRPVMHMDDNGRLEVVSKVHGRRRAINSLFEKYALLAEDPGAGMYSISHGDCIDDALALESMIFEKYGRKAASITDIGPVIGAHSGPGTLALFFVGKHR